LWVSCRLQGDFVGVVQASGGLCGCRAGFVGVVQASGGLCGGCRAAGFVGIMQQDAGWMVVVV
jgi:hypothetical protein